MTARALLASGARRLAAAGIGSARLDARVLLAEAMGVAPNDVPALRRTPSAEELGAYAVLLARRAAREPLAYVIGRKEFWSLDFAVGPGALVPRPETETLIEETLKAFADRAAPLRILDLGTGTGCLLVTALTLYPNAEGLGIDRSEDALSFARQNAARHGVANRCALTPGTWTSAGGAEFDLVLSNPPYLAAAEMDSLAPELTCEPSGALEAGPDGLEAYRALGPAIASVLVPQGRAFLEIGAGQGAGAAAALVAGGLEIVAIAPDLSGIPRCIVARPGR